VDRSGAGKRRGETPVGIRHRQGETEPADQLFRTENVRSGQSFLGPGNHFDVTGEQKIRESKKEKNGVALDRHGSGDTSAGGGGPETRAPNVGGL